MNRSVRRGLIVMLIALGAIAAMMLAPGHKKTHPPNDDPWVLVSYDPDNPVGTYLGNGFISTRIMGDGVGSQTKIMPDGSIQTQPLPCYMAGLYDDEKLIPVPTWSDLRFYDGKTQFRIDKNADYKQSLDMRTGILTTEATWRAGRKTLTGKIEVIVLRDMPGCAVVQAKLVPSFGGVFVADTPVGITTDRLERHELPQTPGSPRCYCLYRCRQSGVCLGLIKLILSSSSISNRKADKSHFSIPIKTEAHKLADVTSYILLGKGSSLDQARQQTDRACMALFKSGAFVSPEDANRAAWAKLWQKDIRIDGPKKDQQAIHSCMFYLLQSVREGSQWSIPPMGLSNNTFSGHVFWDADTWMFPALILQHPELARSIVDYRYNTLPGAIANAKASGYAGAEYAWESGYTGKEDTPPGLVYRHERHINGDVALAQWQYYLATNDLAWLRSRGLPVIRETANYWVSRVSKSAQTGQYEIKQVVPPDENADLVDNSAYTNAIARSNLQIAARAARISGVPENPKWTEIASKLYIPFDDKTKRFIPFDGYKGWRAKQADVELLAYPLQFELPGYVMPFIYTNTYNYYSKKVMPNGPAMTASAYSVIAARLGFGEEAYREFVKSYKPFLRGPFNYFNEKQSKTWDNMCFLTGAAGPIQAAIFGLAGAHMDYFPQDPSTAQLSFHPSLPKQWKSLKITGVQWHGKTFDVTVSKGNKVTMKR